MNVYPSLMGSWNLPFSVHGFGLNGRGLAGAGAEEPGKLSDFSEADQALSQQIYRAGHALSEVVGHPKFPEANKPEMTAFVDQIKTALINPGGPATFHTDDEVYSLYDMVYQLHEKPWMDNIGEVKTWDITSELLKERTDGQITDLGDLRDKLGTFYETYFKTYYDEASPTKKATAPPGKPKAPIKPPVRPKVGVSKFSMGKIAAIGGAALAVGGLVWFFTRKPKQSRWDY